MTTLTATITKEIVYDRETRDYAMYLDGEFVGYEPSYHAAEVELDRLAYEQLDRVGVEPELLQTATALDGGLSIEAIAAEYAEALPMCAACHTNEHAPSGLQPAFCTECVYAMLQGRESRLDSGHNLSTPQPTDDQLLDEAGNLLTRLVALKSQLLHDVPNGETMNARCARLSRLRRISYAVVRAGRRMTRRFVALPAPQPVENLTTCERYSTAPSLALWGPDTPECPKCGQRHDPVVACPGRTIPIVQCANCDKGHHIQRCPEVWRALMG